MSHRTRSRWSPLILVTLGITISWALLFSIILVLRPVEAESELAATIGVTRCADELCFRDLVPDKTTWVELPEELRSGSLSDWRYGEITATPSADGSRLDTLFFAKPLDADITIGAFLAIFGPPVCVTIYPLAGTYIIHYPMLHLHSQVDEDDRLKPSDPIISIVLGNPDRTDPQVAVCDAAQMRFINRQLLHQPWHGLTGMRQYVASANGN